MMIIVIALSIAASSIRTRCKGKELGLQPSFLIGHVRWWGKAFRDEILGPDRAKFYDPCATALAEGLRISFHSDWNVTPIEPLRYVEDAVARVMNDGGDVFFPMSVSPWSRRCAP